MNLVNSVLVIDLTLPGVVVGVIGLLMGIARRQTRKPALIIAAAGLFSYLFHAALYTDVLSALILQVTVCLAFGWLFAVDMLWTWASQRPAVVRAGVAGITALLGVALAGTLIAQNTPFIKGLTEDTTGLETMALVEQTPPDSTLMIAWGYRHFAAGYARDVLGRMPSVTLVEHNADFANLIHERPLITPDFTFYNYPVAWWEERTGGPVYLSAAAPSLVRVSATPDMLPDVEALGAADVVLTCSDSQLELAVTWAAPETPTQDLSVFVHLLAADGTIIAQADQSSPVYGWRPLTSWLPSEAVRDLYALPRLPGGARIRFGLYHQESDGSFVNDVEQVLAVHCGTED